ncbi:MAG TPA: carboxypeptidase regulatory-like domain-containing protein [Gemmatimonadaceae bacterium]|nr:carboxypeptidase regulatory-like domain-containing protein [Gemmatimonadaceae bacterium]
MRRAALGLAAALLLAGSACLWRRTADDADDERQLPLGLRLATAPDPARSAAGHGALLVCVRDFAQDAPVPGARVRLSGTGFGDSTAVDRCASITAPAGRYELRVSRIGYRPETWPVTIRLGLVDTVHAALRRGGVPTPRACREGKRQGYPCV